MDALQFQINDTILDETRAHYLSVLDGSLGKELWGEHLRLTADDLGGKGMDTPGRTLSVKVDQLGTGS